MNVLMRTIRGLTGLFIDDGKLALTIIGVLILVGMLRHFVALDGSLAIALLVTGTISALLANVVRTASTTQR
jgi:hypothetical protein